MQNTKNISHLLLITLSVFFICAGCSVTIFKDYAFTTPIINFSAGTINGGLFGRERTVDKNNSVRGSPYELWVWFSTQTKTSCTIQLSDGALKNIETNTVIPVNLTLMANFKNEYKGHYNASFSMENVNMDFADHELSFVYSFDEGCFTGEQPIKAVLEFKKNFKEENITFWDVLMGV